MPGTAAIAGAYLISAMSMMGDQWSYLPFANMDACETARAAITERLTGLGAVAGSVANALTALPGTATPRNQNQVKREAPPLGALLLCVKGD